MLLGFICTILGIAGVVGLFTGTIILVIVGAIADLVENIVGVTSGEQKNFASIIVFSVIGLIVFLIIGKPFWMGILTGMCFESAIMGIFSLPRYLQFIRFMTRKS